jgi:outer membrane protein assembly factor BamB
MSTRSGVAFLAFCFLLGAAEPDWPQFRGPQSNPVGASPRLAEKWSKTENIEWLANIPGRGWSSPIVTDGKVFLTTVTTDGKSKPPQVGTEYSNQYMAELKKQGLSDKEIMAKVMERDIELPAEVTIHYFLYCLDLKTGKELWKREFYKGQPPGGRHRKNSFSSETPVTDGKHVYVYVANLGLYAFSLKGKQVWSTKLEAMPIYLDFGTGGSAALHGNRLLIVSDNEKQQYIAAFDTRTGKQLWRTDRDLKGGPGGPRSAWATPFIWTTPLRTEVVTLGPGTAVSYDLEGKELWRLGGMGMMPIPSPFVEEGLLILNGGAGGLLAAVRPGASGDISLAKDAQSNEHVAWAQPRAGTYLPSSVAYQGGVYVLTEKGILSRFDARTGKLTYKSRLDVDAGYFTSSPWAYRGKIFCLSEEGKTFVVEAGETFQLLGTNQLEEMAQATPAIVGDRLLLRTESKLYSIKAKP